MSRQPQTNDTPAELVRLGCVLLRILIQWATSAAVARIGRRIDLLSQSAYLPEMGYGDTNAIAACLDLKEPGAEQQLRRNCVPSRRPGERNMFRFSDVPGELMAPAAKSATAKQDGRRKGGKP